MVMSILVEVAMKSVIKIHISFLQSEPTRMPFRNSGHYYFQLPQEHAAPEADVVLGE